jgi:type IV fimbrial biogenesis protein FimT
MRHDQGAGAMRCGRPGFTLIELMVTLAIVTVLLVLAVPSLQDATLNTQLRAQSNALLASLQLARSEAIKRNARVVVCKTADWTATDPACTTSNGWEQGWIVFHDCDNDANRDTNTCPGGTAETVIDRHQPLANGFLLRGGGNVANYISFKPSGSTLMTSGAFQSGSLTLCRSPPAFSSAGKQIVISAVGRARICDTNPLTACPPASLAENCQS